MKRLLPLLLICACKTTSSSESHMAASAADTLDSAQHVETHVEEAPSKVTITIEEFAPPPEVMPSDPAESADLAEPKQRGPATQGAVTQPEHGPLVKRTVSVSERGPVVTDTHVDAKSQERSDSEITASDKQTHSFDFLHGPFALLGGLVVLLGAAYAAFRILKPRLFP